jgi:hypothetical protein
MKRVKPLAGKRCVKGNPQLIFLFIPGFLKGGPFFFTEGQSFLVVFLEKCGGRLNT